MVQTFFPNIDGIFQEENVVTNWYEEHESELEHMEWPPQSPDLDIIEHLLCIQEQQVRNSYPPPSWVKLCDYITRRI